VGQSLGAEDPEGATRIGWRSAAWALGTALALGVLCVLGREPLARLFTDDAEVIAAMDPFLLALALAQPFLQVHFTLAGAHRGAGDNMTPLLAATASNWLFRVPVAWACAAVFGLPLVWVWFTIILDHVTRAGWLFLTFRSGRWQRRLAPARE
jgi:Na+-driven multidrug efflux pump